VSSADFFSVAKRDAFSAAFISGSSVSGSHSESNILRLVIQNMFKKKWQLPGEKRTAAEDFATVDGDKKDDDDDDDEEETTLVGDNKISPESANDIADNSSESEGRCVQRIKSRHARMFGSSTISTLTSKV